MKWREDVVRTEKEVDREVRLEIGSEIGDTMILGMTNKAAEIELIGAIEEVGTEITEQYGLKISVLIKFNSLQLR